MFVLPDNPKPFGGESFGNMHGNMPKRKSLNSQGGKCKLGNRLQRAGGRRDVSR